MHLILPRFEGARPILRRMVVERYLPRRTAVQQVASVFWGLKDKGSIRTALESAFDVEPVTRDFFAEYKRIFENALATVGGFGQGEDEDKRRFVQTLFNRLKFVYFLSRKGWLRFKDDHDYLTAIWRDYQSLDKRNSFYIDKLERFRLLVGDGPRKRLFQGILESW